MPLLRALSASEWASTQASLSWRGLSAGQSLAVRNGRLLFLVEGAAVVYEDGLIAGVVEGPAVVGAYPPGFLRATVPEVRIEPLTDCAVWEQTGPIPRTPATLAEWHGLLEERLQETLSERTRVEQALEDFLYPVDATLKPGPYLSEDSALHFFVLEGLPNKLPRGLLPLPGSRGRSLLVLSHFQDFHPLSSPALVTSYTEAALMQPAIDGLVGPGLFCPAFYPDSGMAVLAGRELFGYPKRLGRASLEERSGVVARDNELSAWLRWDSRSPLGQDDFVRELARALLELPGERLIAATAGEIAELVGLNLIVRGLPCVPLFTRRELGELAAASGPRGIDEVVSSPFLIRRVRQLERLENTRGVLGHELAGARVLGGWSATVSLELDAALAIRDLRPGLRPRLRSAFLRLRAALPGLP